jgi:hypothetical protein
MASFPRDTQQMQVRSRRESFASRRSRPTEESMIIEDEMFNEPAKHEMFNEPAKLGGTNFDNIFDGSQSYAGESYAGDSAPEELTTKVIN